jgi:hypothetical protein
MKRGKNNEEYSVNKFATLILAAGGLVLAASVATASPPPQYTPTYPPTVKIYPTPPKMYYPPTLVVKTPPLLVFPTMSRPYFPVASPIVPEGHDWSVYYRFSPLDPWVRYTSTHNWWRAEEIRDVLAYYYGFEAIVY